MFKAILQGILDESNGMGVVLMGYDGIAVEQEMAQGESVDPHLVAVEYANVLKEVQKAAEVLQTGGLEEVSINTGRFRVILRMLTDEYFVALTLRRDGNFGKARYLLMRDAEKLKKELMG